MKDRQDGEIAQEAAIAILIAVILISLAGYSLFIAPGNALGISARAGMTRATDRLVTAGDLTGYADGTGMLGPVRVDNPSPAPGRLGAVLVPIRLASLRLSWEAGTGADIGNATVIFSGPGGDETLRGSSGPVLRKPAWAIVRKGSVLPGQSGNGDNLLEPNEIFVLFAYPSQPLPPGAGFTIRVLVPGENPFVVSRRVPDSISSTMDLG